jgi:hypothetical protein
MVRVTITLSRRTVRVTISIKRPGQIVPALIMLSCCTGVPQPDLKELSDYAAGCAYWKK